MNPSNLLAWLNFFVADVRDGLGPFLGVFLLQNGFGESQVGLIGGISHIIALSLGVPCGILVDKTTRIYRANYHILHAKLALSLLCFHAPRTRASRD